ncbi:MAG: hypothetical protein EON59_03850 [Alphaproteobacteria bacterium]|nr:MAG: hypothetical protein EON59_03850 [Alphaproteobacteria bacterium]
MNYDREEYMRRQDAEIAMIRMRDQSRHLPPKQQDWQVIAEQYWNELSEVRLERRHLIHVETAARIIEAAEIAPIIKQRLIAAICARNRVEPQNGEAARDDWRVAQMHAELEHLTTSVKGGELYCELCKQLVGEDGTLHPATCPLSYGYDHIRDASAMSARQSQDAEERLGPKDASAVPATPGDARTPSPESSS